MSIGFTQLILLLIVALIFFGNLPKLFKDLSTGLLAFKQYFGTSTVSSQSSGVASPSVSVAASVQSNKSVGDLNADTPEVVSKFASEKNNNKSEANVVHVVEKSQHLKKGTDSV